MPIFEGLYLENEPVTPQNIFFIFHNRKVSGVKSSSQIESVISFAKLIHILKGAWNRPSLYN